MTRILMIAPTPFFSDRGCHVRIYEEAKFLAGRGHEVLVLSYPIGEDPPGIDVARPRRLLSYDRREAGPSWQRLFLDAQVAARAFKVCRDFKPDLIHAHLHEGCMIGMTIKKLYHKPLLFDYQGSLTGESVQHGFVAGDGVMAGLFGRVEAMIDRGADAIVVSSEHLADPLRKRGLPAEAVPDWVDTDLFSPGPPDLSLSRELGLPEGVPVIVYLGVMSDYQGVDILLNAALELKENKVPFHLLAMGYPEVGYANLAGSLGLGGEMTFTGRVNYFEACRHLRLGRVAVAPKLSRTESNGKMLNYLACGLPAVAFDLPVNRDIAGESALYVQPDDDRDTCASALAAALQKLLEDRGLADKLGREGRQRALDRLSAQVLGDRLISAYGRLLEGRT